MSFGVISGSYFTVCIPKASGDVVVSECRGTSVDSVEVRLTIARQKWESVATALKDMFNQRLKGRRRTWKSGENHVERQLGYELMVLLWAIEDADLRLIAKAVVNWRGLRPEERWWLYYHVNVYRGKPCHRNMGWRVALKVALTENPIDEPTFGG